MRFVNKCIFKHSLIFFIYIHLINVHQLIIKLYKKIPEQVMSLTVKVVLIESVLLHEIKDLYVLRLADPKKFS